MRRSRGERALALMPEFNLPPDDLPPPSAELVLLRVVIESHLATAPRKRAERYLRTITEKLAAEENLSAVFQIRPTAQHEEVRRARRQAALMFERLLPIFLARLGTRGD